MELLNIDVNVIIPHPGNPRKDLGDLTELADSIKKNGLMQNLVVMPHGAKYALLIGHRRLAAAKLAGLTEVPCKVISDLKDSDQVAIMLEENIQRADLTIWEQSQGYQLMLDLGATEDDIAAKTGMSRATVKHRLNIAKLDQNALKTKDQDTAYQMNLTDLYALEAVGDLDERNRILNASTSSSDLEWRVQSYVQTKARAARAEQIINILVGAGVPIAPDGVTTWSNGWDAIKRYSCDAEEEITLPDNLDGCNYLVSTREVVIVRKQKPTAKVKTSEDIAREKQAQNKDHIKDITKAIKGSIKDYVGSLARGDVKPEKPGAEVCLMIWQNLLDVGFYSGIASIASVAYNVDFFRASAEEKDSVKAKVLDMPTYMQQLVILYSAIASKDLVSYDGKYNVEGADKINKYISLLELFGYRDDDKEHKQILDGTSELFIA